MTTLYEDLLALFSHAPTFAADAVAASWATLKDHFLGATGFYYWPFLLSAAVIALMLHLALRSSASGLAESVSKKVLWHRSSRADYVYFLVNTVVHTVIFAPMILSSAWVAGEGATLLWHLMDPPGLIDGDSWTGRLLFTVGFFVAYDFGRFLAHWLQHTVPLLWQFHKVHHSAECLNILTSSRAHPVDLLLMGLGGNLGVGLFTALFVWLAGGGVTPLFFLGHHILFLAYRAVGMLRHTHIRLGYGPLEAVFVSPAMHQLHHSADPKHFNVNMGFALSIWDRMFGTHHKSAHVGSYPMGLGDGSDGSWHGIATLYFRPFRLAAALVRDGLPPRQRG